MKIYIRWRKMNAIIEIKISISEERGSRRKGK
jgi:hypothetical protein